MAFPDYLVVDDFNRGDEDPLSGGGAWDGPLRSADNRLKIVSNQVAHSTGSGAVGTAYYTTPLVAPFQVWCEIPNASGDQGIDYCIQQPKLTGEAHGYRFQSNGSVLQLYRITEGNFTQIGGDYSINLIDGDALGVKILNTVHFLYHRTGGVWSSVDMLGESGYHSGYAGMMISANSSARMDNFSAVQTPHDYPTFPDPSISILDDFNRANETPLSGGGNWGTPLVSGDPNLNLSSNVVIHATAVPPTSAAWWTPQQFSPPFDIFCTVGSDDSNVGVDYCIQQPGTAGPDGYRWGIHPGSVSPSPSEQGRRLQFYRFDNDVFTDMFGVSWGIESKAGDQVGARLLAGGTHLFFYKPVGGAWQLIVDVTGENAYTSGYGGVFVGHQAAGMSVDNFGIGAFPTQTSPYFIPTARRG